jgi:hypothetical protein
MKREQKILYGLLALVIFFIIWKFFFNKNENFTLISQSGDGIFGGQPVVGRCGLLEQSGWNFGNGACEDYDNCVWNRGQCQRRPEYCTMEAQHNGWGDYDRECCNRPGGNHGHNPRRDCRNRAGY